MNEDFDMLDDEPNSKGKADNVGQMLGCLGLHTFEGKLICNQNKSKYSSFSEYIYYILSLLYSSK